MRGARYSFGPDRNLFVCTWSATGHLPNIADQQTALSVSCRRPPEMYDRDESAGGSMADSIRIWKCHGRVMMARRAAKISQIRSGVPDEGQRLHCAFGYSRGRIFGRAHGVRDRCSETGKAAFPINKFFAGHSSCQFLRREKQRSRQPMNVGTLGSADLVRPLHLIPKCLSVSGCRKISKPRQMQSSIRLE